MYTFYPFTLNIISTVNMALSLISLIGQNIYPVSAFCVISVSQLFKGQQMAYILALLLH